MVSLLKAVGGPGSIGFLAVCLAVGLMVGRAAPRWRRAARAWIVLVFLGYAVLGMPWFANRIAGRLSSYSPLQDVAPVRGANTLIVLDGDNSEARVRECRRLYEAMDRPLVVASGGDDFVRALIDAGIPAGVIRRDLRSRTTREQVAHLMPWLTSPDRRALVVASRLQMPRLAGLLEAAGVHTHLAPSGLDAEPPTSGPWQAVPSYAALCASRDAIYEYIALAYYRHRGWI